MSFVGGTAQTVGVPLVIAFLTSRNILNYQWDRARARIQIGLYNLLQVGGIGFGFLAGIALLLYRGADASSVLLGFSVTQGLALLVGLLLTDMLRSIGLPRMAILTAAIRYGLPIMAGQFLGTLTLNAPRFIVAKMLGLEAAGVFAIGYGVGMRVSSLAVMLVTPGAYPLAVRTMAKEGLEAGFRQLKQNIIIVNLVLFPSALGLLAINEQLVVLTVGPTMQTATLLILPAATVAGMTRYLRSHTTEQAFLLTGQTMITLKVSILDCLLCVVLTIIGVHYYGLYAAAFLPIVSGLTALVISNVSARRLIGFTLPYGVITKIAASALTMFVTLKALHHFMPGINFTNMAILVIVGALTYALMITILFRSQVRSVFRFKKEAT
jgi:O-antigen/teichoic acid export membrane protein